MYMSHNAGNIHKTKFWRSSDTGATTPKDWNYILEELDSVGESQLPFVPHDSSPRLLPTNAKTRSRGTIILPVVLCECEPGFPNYGMNTE